MVNFSHPLWALEIVVENVEKSHTASQDDIKVSSPKVIVRVRGDQTIGQVMASVSEQCAVTQDWSDYVFWWPERRKWLSDSKKTLDQYDVDASAKLLFTTAHKMLRILTPDQSVCEMRVDFSIDVFSATAKLCHDLSISYPEELSFARPLTTEQLRKKNPLDASHASLASPSNTSTLSSGASRFDRQASSDSYANASTLNNRSNGSLQNMSNGTMSSSNSLNTTTGQHSVGTASPIRDKALRLKSLAKRARVHSLWLNSSISLYEQDVVEFDTICLKFKYYTFFDLNLSKDITRINYIYEQLRWATLTEELPCTEDEMYTLAGINLQVMLVSGMAPTKMPVSLFGTTSSTFYTNSSLAMNTASRHHNGNGHHHHNGHNGNNGHHHNNNNNGHIEETIIEDEIDSALENLERSLEGSTLNGKNGHNGNGHGNNILVLPKLCAKLKVHAQKRVSTLSKLKFMSSYKLYYCVFQETTFTGYKSADYNEKSDAIRGQAAFVLNMKRCEVNYCAVASQHKYCFQVVQSTEEGVVEYLVKCADQQQFAQWFAACKQASTGGHTMAHVSYEEELKNTLKLLQIQATQSKATAPARKDLNLDNIQLEYLISSKYLKKRPKEQIMTKIRNVHANFSNSSLLEAQMSYIKACQVLRNFSMSLFIIRFAKNKKEEYLGIAPDKIVLMDTAGQLLKTWKYSSLIDWNVNWEVKRMQINFNTEKIEFECLSADCKVIHEFIGGYIYMSMRHRMNNTHDREQFLKLTGGWDEQEPDDN